MNAETCRLCTGEPVEAGDVLGPRCLRRLERVLVDMPALVLDLELTITRQTRGAGAPRVKGAAQPLPFAASAEIDQAHAGVAILVEWARHVAGNPPAAARTSTQRARWASAALLASREWFQADEQAHEAARAVLQIRAALRRAVDRPAARFYAGRCGAELTTLVLDCAGEILTPRAEVTTCDGDVYAEPGDPLALCAECRVCHPVVERRDALLGALEWEVLPLPEILAALPVLTGRNPDPATVRQWRARGRLEPAQVTPAGVRLYRGGDVLRLARDTGTRPGPQRRDRVPA